MKTADDVYVRFHGTKQWYRHDYTKAELAVWADRIRASGAKRVWAYFNNDREGLRDQERAASCSGNSRPNIAAAGASGSPHFVRRVFV